MKELINDIFEPHINLCKQTFDQIVLEWGHSTVALKKWLKIYHPENQVNEYAKKCNINADLFLPYRNNFLWSGQVAISRLTLSMKAKVIIVFSETELTEAEQIDLYVTECLRLWCRINSLTTKFTYNQFKDLMNTCYAEVTENWDDAVIQLQLEQEAFKFKRKQTMYHYTDEDFNNIFPTMTLSEAYNDWLNNKFPYLLKNFRYKKLKEFGDQKNNNEWSEDFAEYKLSKLKQDLDLIKIKCPKIRAFAKLLKVHNIKYKQRK